VVLAQHSLGGAQAREQVVVLRDERGQCGARFTRVRGGLLRRSARLVPRSGEVVLAAQRVAEFRQRRRVGAQVLGVLLDPLGPEAVFGRVRGQGRARLAGGHLVGREPALGLRKPFGGRLEAAHRLGEDDDGARLDPRPGAVVP